MTDTIEREARHLVARFVVGYDGNWTFHWPYGETVMHAETIDEMERKLAERMRMRRGLNA